MDRSRIDRLLPRLTRAALLAALVALYACEPHATRGRPLAPGERASQPAVDLGKRKVIATDTLAYHVALSESQIVSIELTTQFDMVVRDLPGHTPKSSEKRIFLDTPTYDILDLALSPDGKKAYVASAAGWVRRYAIEEGELELEWRMGNAVTALAITDDNSYLLIGTDRGTICLRRLRDGAQLQCMIAHEGRIGALAIHHDLLASASWQGELGLWSIPSLENRSLIKGGGSIAALAFAPNGASLALARNRHAPVRSQAIADKEKHGHDIYATGDNQIERWQLRGRRLGQIPVQHLVGHRSLITGLALTASSLLSVSWDASVRLWNIKTGLEVGRLMGFQHILRDLAITSEGGRVAVASWGATRDAAAITWLTLFFPAD